MLIGSGMTTGMVRKMVTCSLTSMPVQQANEPDNAPRL
jgi:hypothetical protein